MSKYTVFICPACGKTSADEGQGPVLARVLAETREMWLAARLPDDPPLAPDAWRGLPPDDVINRPRVRAIFAPPDGWITVAYEGIVTAACGPACVEKAFTVVKEIAEHVELAT